MNRRQGFTLMELLLVVAVLAIVAAAAAPTFFGGAKEAMDEAKKASFLSAYQNTVSGANMALSILASKGTDLGTDGTITDLETYAPLAARTFALSDGTTNVALSARYITADSEQIDGETFTKGSIVVYYNTVTGTSEPEYSTNNRLGKTTTVGLSNYWTTMNKPTNP